MAETSIQWCSQYLADNSDQVIYPGFTFNPWIGCSKVSAGCTNCYAERDQANRYNRVRWGPGGTRSTVAEATWRNPIKANNEAAKLRAEHSLHYQTRPWQRLRVFCASLADIGEMWNGVIMNHEKVLTQKPLVVGPMFNTPSNAKLGEPESAWWHLPTMDQRHVLTMNHVRVRLFEMIRVTSELEWLLLTKRPESLSMVFKAMMHTIFTDRLDEFLAWFVDWHTGIKVPNNVRLGTSIESQSYIHRFDELVNMPAAQYFISAEPLLGRLDLSKLFDRHARLVAEGRISVIVGGESGDNARPSHPSWYREIRDTCGRRGVPFHFKQHGEWIEEKYFDEAAVGKFATQLRKSQIWEDGSARQPISGIYRHTNPIEVRRVGVDKAGRKLDGRFHNALAADLNPLPAKVQASLFGE